MIINEKEFFWGALVGATLATLSALLFTTKKGKELQDKIGDACKDAGEKIKDAFFEAKEQAEETVQDVKDSAEHYGKKAVSKVQQET